MELLKHMKFVQSENADFKIKYLWGIGFEKLGINLDWDTTLYSRNKSTTNHLT